jgi:hypothetical protein
MNSLKYVALVAALGLSLGGQAMAQSNTGTTNGAPNATSSFVPKTGSSKPETNVPAGVTNAAPNAGNTSFPKEKRAHRSGKNSGSMAPAGVNNAAPNAKIKKKVVKKATSATPKPGM